MGVPGSDVFRKLQCPQPVYLRAYQSASVLGDALQHDLLSQHDGALRPGYCSQSYGGESPQHYIHQFADDPYFANIGLVGH